MSDRSYQDAITVITGCTPRGHPIANRHYTKQRNRHGELRPQFPLLHRYKVIPIGNIFDLSKTLAELEDDSQSCVIRGAPISGLAQPCHRRNINFDDTPHHWVCFDFDSIPGDLSPIEIVTSCLPPEFHDASFHWQHSGSQGFKPGTRLHIWLWMDTPVTCIEWKEWISTHGIGPDNKPTIQIDPVLYNRVQPHITSNPILIGVNDPVPVRSGLEIGKTQAVNFQYGEHPITSRRRAKSASPMPPLPDEWLSKQTGDIGRFNLRHKVGDVLDWFGYQRFGNRYLHPYSQSLMPDTLVNSGTHVYAFSPNNPLYEQGVDRDTGEILNRNHDAFDCLRILGYEGDMAKAIVAAKTMLDSD